MINYIPDDVTVLCGELDIEEHVDREMARVKNIRDRVGYESFYGDNNNICIRNFEIIECGVFDL